MHSIVSRPQPLGTTTSSHRVPRKSASFLSLRREKDKSPGQTDPSYAVADSHSRPSYFEAYPRPKTANGRTNYSKGRDDYAVAATSSDGLSFSDHTLREKTSSPKVLAAYAFPTVESSSVESPSTPQFRVRSKTGPSRKPSWTEPPSLRISSTSTQNSETPPDTPVDNYGFRDLSVLVAAPVSGVETMDALVDGMNNGDDLLTSSLNRAQFGIPGHHPLYQPPLPTPPPGVVLGGGKARRTPKKPPKPPPTYSSDEDDESPVPTPKPPSRRRPKRQPTRSSSSTTITVSLSGPSEPSSITQSPPKSFPSSTSLSRRSSRDSFGSSLNERPRSVAPSISEIIKAYAPVEAQARSRASPHRTGSYARSHDHATVHEESEPEPEPLSKEEEAELLSRSSMDSVADEVLRTLRTQAVPKALQPSPPPPPPPSSYTRRYSTFSDNASITSPLSEGGSASLYSMSISSHPTPSPSEPPNPLSSLSKPSPSQAVAQYLRSARLTTLLRLTRSPHASSDNPLTVSLSDLGNPSGIPIVVFLGLGCVRHIMGLYEEMAECLNLRLITIDRWGLGRTEPRAKSAKGIIQWASVVEEVLDLLHIERCSVMAHSAGAPYALSFANRLSKRVCGDVCLLAPWVGGSESGGYKWLKYVPNGLLKTAQAAEWKLQAWMIGKPPTITYEGIGFNLQSQTPSKPSPRRTSPPPHRSDSLQVLNPPRPSTASSTFSDYDDLQDFNGRFESQSTLGPETRNGRPGVESVAKRKPSKSLFDRFKAPSSPPTESRLEEKTPRRGLKALRSMSSLKAKSTTSKASFSSSPQLPPTLSYEVGLSFDGNWPKSIGSESSLPKSDQLSSMGPGYRASGRRSLSFNSRNGVSSMPSSPNDISFSSNASLPAPNSGQFTHGFQALLANALIAASHSESAKGTHNDLLQILNHDNHPWGFSYTSYPHNVKVWYGDRDEKIAENAVRWMERTMGNERCSVNVVRGADHSLMYKSSVVVEVLEYLASFWTHD